MADVTNTPKSLRLSPRKAYVLCTLNEDGTVDEPRVINTHNVMAVSLLIDSLPKLRVAEMPLIHALANENAALHAELERRNGEQSAGDAS